MTGKGVEFVENAEAQLNIHEFTCIETSDFIIEEQKANVMGRCKIIFWLCVILSTCAVRLQFYMMCVYFVGDVCVMKQEAVLWLWRGEPCSSQCEAGRKASSRVLFSLFKKLSKNIFKPLTFLPCKHMAFIY